MHLVEIGVDSKNIFFVNRELRDFNFIETESDLDSLFKLYMKELKPQGKIYLFIDEIQNINDWERFVNSYSQDYTMESELFISASNSNMLSGELATLLSGRYIKFQVFPFSYGEYIGFWGMEKNKKSFTDYVNIGGMPEMYRLSAFRNFLYKGFLYGIGYQLENLIFLDLLRAGYSVYTGNIKGKEVDFEATRGDRTIYIQSTYMMVDEEVACREYASLEIINDSFEKYVVSMDEFTRHSKMGIRNIQAWQFEDIIK